MKRLAIVCVLILFLLPGCTWPWAGIETTPGRSEAKRLIEEKGPGDKNAGSFTFKYYPNGQYPTTQPSGGAK